MSILQEMREKRQKNAANAAQSNAVKTDEWLATMSNPDSNIDELGKLIRYFILPLFALWVWYIGYIFTSKALVGVVDPWQATLLAFALPGVIQFLKLYGAKKTLRAFHFKWYDRSAHDLWLWSLVAIVVCLMFAWSLKISFFDVKDTARDNYLNTHTDSLSLVMAAATKGIDSQIEAINKSNQEAGTMKTKRGKIAWSGQKIRIDNSTTLSSLMYQRQQIASQALEDYKAGKVRTNETATSRGNFFQRFGGFGEIGEILFCLILGLVEAINRNNNIKRLSNTEGGNQAAENTLHSPYQYQQKRNGQAQNSTSTTNSIGFKWDGYGKATAQEPNTVSQQPDTVSQPTAHFSTLGCDAVLQLCEKRVRADLPNFLRKDTKPESVSRRINDALQECYESLKNPDFAPSRQAGASFYKFMVETAVPTLDGRGWPFENATFLLKRLLEVIPKGDAVLA